MSAKQSGRWIFLFLSLGLVLSTGIATACNPDSAPPPAIELTPADAAAWAEATSPQGVRYVACCLAGLVSERDIYLAVDADADGRFEELLPTGLSDVYQRFRFPGGVDESGQQGQLSLSLEPDGVWISHNLQSMETPASGEMPVELRIDFVSEFRSFAELRRDTDGDGLSDILERLLCTDPARADTDGDGQPDLTDMTPNVDEQSMGTVERGIARALAYLRDQAETRGNFDRWLKPERGKLPWPAVYLQVDGAGRVAYDPGTGVRWISLAGDADYSAYQALLAGYPGFSCLNLSWPERMLDTAQAFAALEGRSADQVSTDDLADWAKANRDHLGEGLYVLELSAIGTGWEVLLARRDGEYYPVLVRMTWIV